MANFDTFGDLKNRVRDGLADHRDLFFSEAEIEAALNEGQWEIYKILHTQNQGEFFNATPETITLSNSTNYYALTNDFAAVDEIRPTNDSDRWRRFMFKSRHDQEFRDLLNYPSDILYYDDSLFYFDVVSDKTLIIVPRVMVSLSVQVYTIKQPVEMTLDADTPTLKKIWRPLAIEYAVRKLKNKEETGEYASHEKLLGFLLDNLGKFAGPRAETNSLTVESYLGY